MGGGDQPLPAAGSKAAVRVCRRTGGVVSGRGLATRQILDTSGMDPEPGGRLLVLLAVLGGWMWAYRPYRPPPDAQLAYDRGVDALHSMAYETARKAFEQTVAIDPAFALAHASLARAYDELDYTDRAKDAMLRAIAAAQESRLTPDDGRRLRALQFMVQRDYERAAPLVRQVEAEATGTGQAAAALESGWLAQQMENSEAAAAAFERALTLDPSYAAAKLRLGFLFGRQGGKDDTGAFGLQRR